MAALSEAEGYGWVCGTEESPGRKGLNLPLHILTRIESDSRCTSRSWLTTATLNA